MDGKKYVKIGKAAEMIGCSPQTLRNYERKGIFVPEAVLETGHRMYSVEQIEKFICHEQMGEV